MEQAMLYQALALQMIHILFVDLECIDDAAIKEMFSYFSCEVTIVRLASVALSLLKSGNCHFDLLLINIDSPDSYGTVLLNDAIAMGVPVITMAYAIDPLAVVRGMEAGAIFCIELPLTLEFVKYAWQHVLREKIHKIQQHVQLQSLMPYNGSLMTGTRQEHNNDGQSSIPITNVRATRMNLISNEGESISVQSQRYRRHGKDHWIEWTPELHGKFVDAVKTLGEGRCYPKEILELMNVPGLRRMQVASHLQKCRSGSCNYMDSVDQGYDDALKSGISKKRPRRFGTMPMISKTTQMNTNIQENIGGHYLANQPTLNSPVQETIVDHSTVDPNIVLSAVPDNIHGHTIQIHATPEESAGHIPFGNVELEDGGTRDISTYDMLVSDDPPLFDAPIGMDIDKTPNQDFELLELLKDINLDDAVLYGRQEPTYHMAKEMR